MPIFQPIIPSYLIKCNYPAWHEILELWGHIGCVVCPFFLVWKMIFFSPILFTYILHIIDKNRQNTSRKTAKSGVTFIWLDLQTSLRVLLTQKGDVKSGKRDITTLRLLDEGSERHWGQNKGRTLTGAPLHTPSVLLSFITFKKGWNVLACSSS